MDKVFELVYKSGPHGDACSTYTLKFFGEPTLREFIEYVLEHCKEEWGEIRVHYDDPNAPEYAAVNEKENYVSIEYKYGYVTKSYDGSKYDESAYRCEGYTNLTNQLLDRKINLTYNNWANGGWSCMDYWIKIKIV